MTGFRGCDRYTQKVCPGFQSTTAGHNSFHFKYGNFISKIGNNLQCVLTVFKTS